MSTFDPNIPENDIKTCVISSLEMRGILLATRNVIMSSAFGSKGLGVDAITGALEIEKEEADEF